VGGENGMSRAQGSSSAIPGKKSGTRGRKTQGKGSGRDFNKVPETIGQRKKVGRKVKN